MLYVSLSLAAEHCMFHSDLDSSVFNRQVIISFLLLVSFQVDPSSDSVDGKKSRITRKHVIIAVTCAVVTAMVITGIIVGVKFFLDSSTEIVKV